MQASGCRPLLLALALAVPAHAEAPRLREVLDASDPFLYATALSADPYGRVDVFTFDDLFRFVPGAGTRPPIEFGWSRGVLREPDGSVVVAHETGAYRLRLDDTVEALVPWSGDGTTGVDLGNDVALTSDGSVYLSDQSGHLFRRDPAGVVSLVPDATAHELAAGPDGSLWWTSPHDPIVRRLLPGGTTTVAYDGTGGGAGPALGYVMELEVDGEGRAWLTDLNHQLVRIAPDGGAEVVLSSAGAGSGPPTFPGLVCAAADGALWLDAGDNRILRIAPDGTLRIVLERRGDGAHSWSGPTHLAVDAGGNAFASAEDSHNVFRIAPDGALTQLLDASGDGSTPLERPRRVAPDGAGGAFVGDNRGRIFHADASGAVTLRVGSPHPLTYGFPVAGMALGPDGDLFYMETNGRGIFRLPATGELEVFYPGFAPDSLIADSDGAVYATNRRLHLVWRIAPDSAFPVLDSQGDRLGNPLLEPDHLALGPDRSLYVTSGTGSIFRRSVDGQVTHLPSGAYVDGPAGLAVDASGTLFVSGARSRNLVRRSPDGVFGEILNGQSLGDGPHLIGPAGLALDPNGDVFVSALWSHNVFRVRPDGSASEVIGPAGAGPGHELSEPVDVDVAPSGVVYALGASGRVLRLDLRDECGDGVDNDGDGALDFDDPSCGVGPAERDPALACDDGIDNDGDGAIDAADPLCQTAPGSAEAPACDDGLDNDGDGGIDWDGAGVADMDPDCQRASQLFEALPRSCGLGAEVPLVLGAWWGWRRRARALAPAQRRVPEPQGAAEGTGSGASTSISRSFRFE